MPKTVECFGNITKDIIQLTDGMYNDQTQIQIETYIIIYVQAYNCKYI